MTITPVASPGRVRLRHGRVAAASGLLMLAAAAPGAAEAQGTAPAAPAAATVPAVAPVPTPPTAAAAVPARFVLPLARLVGDDKPVRLGGVAGSLAVSLPMPALWKADDVRLTLAGTISQALLPFSQLAVSVNGTVVDQIGLDGAQRQFRRELTVPVRLLRAGFNDVRLTVAQHYSEKCEYPMATQLWTDIDLAGSQFVVSATPQAVPLRLDRLDVLFDKSVLADTAVVGVLTAAPPAGPVLGAVGLAAQGIGQRHDHVPVRLASGRFPADMAQLVLPGGARGAVVLGTFASLQSYLAGLDIPADSGPVVAVRPLRGDATRFVVVLAARTEAELPLAATAFAMQRMPWPDRDWAAIRELKLPPREAIADAAADLKPSTEAYPLKALGYTTTSYSGLPTGSAVLRFWNASWQGRVQVRVHTSYGAGMAAQSALNVVANGTMHGSIPFNNPAGGIFDNYAVSVPSGSLKLGWNTLELQPVLVPQTNGGECKPFFLGNLVTTIYDDSTLQIFGGSPLRRPDLALLARDGRASPTAAVGPGMAIQLTDSDDATVGAGLTLVAKLAQVYRGPLLRTNFTVGDDPAATNRIWVGAAARLPAAVRTLAGLGGAGGLSLPVPLIQAVQVPVIEGGDTLAQLREATQGLAAPPVTLSAQVGLDGALDDRTVATTVFDADDHPLTVFTANTPALLQAGLHSVVGYGPWAQLRGGVAFWRPGGTTVQAISEDDAPFVAYSLRGGLGLWISQYPWWSLAMLLLLVALMVLLTRMVLAGYRRRHLPLQGGQRRDDGTKA